MNKKLTLNETLQRIHNISGTLNEIDWENNFSDVKRKCLSTSWLESHLNTVVKNSQLKPYKRTDVWRKQGHPYIHASVIKDNDVDVESFIKDITAPPEDILSKNGKMKNGDDENTVVFNIGIPALHGLVYDMDKNQFYNINTCPGAGVCSVICYALKGSYIMFPGVFRKQTRILNLLLNDPENFENRVFYELVGKAYEHKNKKIKFRWNDSGDFFSKTYIAIAHNVNKRLKKEGFNVDSYAYTKVAGALANLDDPNDILTTFSGGSNKKESDKAKFKNKKNEKLISSELTDKYNIFVKAKNGKKDSNNKNLSYVIDPKTGKTKFTSPDKKDALKNIVSFTTGVDYNTLIFTDELPYKEDEQPGKYNVIVLPSGDSDIGAQRRDVNFSFLCEH